MTTKKSLNKMPEDWKPLAEALTNDTQKLRKQRIVILSTGIDECTSSEFINEIMILITESKEPIRVIISSPGGDLLDGLTIIRAIQYAQKMGIEVTGEVFGHALSMAFIILQACNKRIMGEGDFIMCHGFFTVSTTDRKGREAEDKWLKDAEEYICRMIAKHNNSKHKEFQVSDYWHVLMAEETPNYYTASEALDMGLVDEVV